ncbi:MAG: hypothetical protein Q8T08_00810, partial [Ignavibacteria bacterium]|nr:hypothetical protein [Ignavibacteria bacterium]
SDQECGYYSDGAQEEKGIIYGRGQRQQNQHPKRMKAARQCMSVEGYHVEIHYVSGDLKIIISIVFKMINQFTVLRKPKTDQI